MFFVAFSNPVLHQVQKAHLRQYQKLHKNTVNYSAFCKASANQVDTEHLQENIFHAKSRKVGPGKGVTIYIYIYIKIIKHWGPADHSQTFFCLKPAHRSPRSLAGGGMKSLLVLSGVTSREEAQAGNRIWAEKTKVDWLSRVNSSCTLVFPEKRASPGYLFVSLQFISQRTPPDAGGTPTCP